MSQLREAVTQGQETSHRSRTKRSSIGFFLLIGASVAIANLLLVYEEHGIRDVILAAVVWMVLYPLIGYWRYSRKSR
jgi:hypothetical protein